VNRAAVSVRGALKEGPAKEKAAAQELFSFRKASWENGVQGEKVHVSSKGHSGI